MHLIPHLLPLLDAPLLPSPPTLVPHPTRRAPLPPPPSSVILVIIIPVALASASIGSVLGSPELDEDQRADDGHYEEDGQDGGARWREVGHLRFESEDAIAMAGPTRMLWGIATDRMYTGDSTDQTEQASGACRCTTKEDGSLCMIEYDTRLRKTMAASPSPEP